MTLDKALETLRDNTTTRMNWDTTLSAMIQEVGVKRWFALNGIWDGIRGLYDVPFQSSDRTEEHLVWCEMFDEKVAK